MYIYIAHIYIHTRAHTETKSQAKLRPACAAQHRQACEKCEDAAAHVGWSCPRKGLECVLVEEQRLDPVQVSINAANSSAASPHGGVPPWLLICPLCCAIFLQ